MPDVGQLDTAVPVPELRVLFWRRSNETMTRRRNPIFNTLTGVVPEEVFVADWLHAMSLGIYKVWIHFVWHTMFEHNVFELFFTTATVHTANCVSHLRSLLFSWYQQEQEAGRIHTRVQDLPPSLVGTPTDGTLGSWGPKRMAC